MPPEHFEKRLGELHTRGKVRRNYEPSDFEEVLSAASGPADEAAVRKLLRDIDSGRFYDFLDEAHKLLSRSDLKNREQFVEHFSDNLVRWIKVFGEAEDLNTFPDIDV